MTQLSVFVTPYFLFLSRRCFNCHSRQLSRPLLSLVTPHSFEHILVPPYFITLCGLVTHSTLLRVVPGLFLSFFSSPLTRLAFSSCLLLRCGPRRAGEALHPEATTVLRSLRLPVRPAERPEMEGSEAGGAERNGGVHHPQQECHHRAHLPGGGAYGQ